MSIILENIISLIILYLIASQNFKRNYKVFIVWMGVLFLSLFLYSSLIINDAQIHRYKTPIIIFVLYGYYYNIKIKTKYPLIRKN